MTLDELVEGVEQLCSLPDAVIRANELIDSPGAGAADIGEVISKDPALSAQLLRLVNSAFYSFQEPINSLKRAISVVGTRELRSLILSASAADVFNQIAPDTIDMNDFWQRSVYVGLIAGKLSKHLGIGRGEIPFLIGLLHDVGKIVLFNRLPEAMGRILEEAEQSGRPLYQVENEHLGFCAADVGASLLQSWSLGDSICVPIRYQHSPDEAPSDLTSGQVLNLSIAVTACVEPELKQTPTLELESLDIDRQWLAETTVTLEDLDTIIMEVNLECFDVLQIVNPGALSIY